MLSKKETINCLKFSIGLKYFLNGFSCFQKEIELFINKCRELENKEGYIESGLTDFKKNEIYQFLSGPFVNRFFKLISFQEKKIKILLGGFETYIDKNKYFFRPA